MSQIIEHAYDLLLQHRIVEIEQPLSRRSPENGWSFAFTASVSHPNPEDVPPKVLLEAVIPEGFPFVPVDFYSKCEQVAGFPHQSTESGKLCLSEDGFAPQDAGQLVRYVNGAKKWLHDAAHGILIQPGDPYELPDFRVNIESLLNQPVFFSEIPESYEKWKLYIGSYGTVEYAQGKGISALMAIRFLNRGGHTIWKPSFSSSIVDTSTQVVGQWLLLPNICYNRHRPPLTFDEIRELCSSNGLPFNDILQRVWGTENDKSGVGLILIGFPIPEVWGGKPVEIHWQPLVFPNLIGMRGKWSNGRNISSHRIWQGALKENGAFAPRQRLSWGKSINVTRERLYARGAYTPAVCAAQVAVFGCGALGSAIAELLARGGVTKLDLFDPGILELGNLCRHTLHGRNVGFSKATSLAKDLSATCPLSNISGHMVEAPLISSSPDTAWEALASAELVVDCTTSESAFRWLNDYAVAQGKRLVSVFLSFRAEFLTLCISGTGVSCCDVFHDFLSYVGGGQVPIESEAYFHQPTREEEIIEGVGCWHPTFPALGAHIWLLAAAALELVHAHLRQDNENGLAALIRRNPLASNSTQPSQLVEVLWTKEYL